MSTVIQNVQANRPYDHIYDPHYITSHANDHYRETEAMHVAHVQRLKDDNAALQDYVVALGAEVEAKALEKKQLEQEQEKVAAEYSAFICRVWDSSARPVLHESLDVNSAELLGEGHYGYVMTCKKWESDEKVILKLQGIHRLDEAVRDWARGGEVGKHPHITEAQELCVHSDSDGSIQERLLAGFRSGTLTGSRPLWFPNVYCCTLLEYMDYGSVCSLVELKLLTLEGVCAVTRQVSSALAFMHQKMRVHNDVRPSNILLKRASYGNVLLVKLADVGAGELSTDRLRDRELLAYTIWCMVVGKGFSRCPSSEERPQAMAELMKGSLLGRRASARATALIESVSTLWNDNAEITQIACRAEFEGCEVTEPDNPEVRSLLTASADLEVTKRAKDSLERLRPAAQEHYFPIPGHDDRGAVAKITALAPSRVMTCNDSFELEVLYKDSMEVFHSGGL